MGGLKILSSPSFTVMCCGGTYYLRSRVSEEARIFSAFKHIKVKCSNNSMCKALSVWLSWGFHGPIDRFAQLRIPFFKRGFSFSGRAGAGVAMG